MKHHDVIVVGAGHGGAQTALALRQLQFAGSVLLIGDESDLPYQRPPLSKDYLTGDKQFQKLAIRPARVWDELRIDRALGSPVVEVDPQARTVRLASGVIHAYDKLVWAAGGAPRQLVCPGADLTGVHYLRGRADADAIRDEITAGRRRIAIIGGGYIGLEVSAALRRAGCTVTLLEVEERVLARVAGEAISCFYEREHRARGVDLQTRAAVVAIEGDAGHVNAVRLADGTLVTADMVVVGIGILPNVAPLLACGAQGNNGVDVDEYCRTCLPHIFAVGDCATHTNAFAQGERIRLESVQNANDMAGVVARAIVGSPVPYHALPWFWSNQFDLKLQTVGISRGHDQVVVRGDQASRSFSVLYLKNGRMIAADCVNAVKDYVQAHKLIESGARIPAAVLANTAIALKEAALPA